MKPYARSVATVTSVLLMCACTPQDNPNSPATQSTAPPSSSATDSPSASVSRSTEQSESPTSMAEQAVVKYWRLLDQAASDPSVSLTGLAKVARGTALTQWQQILARQRGKRYTQTGSVVVEDATATKNGQGRWTVKACLDVTKVNVVDNDGRSVRGTGPQRIEYSYVVERDGRNYYVLDEKPVGEC